MRPRVSTVGVTATVVASFVLSLLIGPAPVRHQGPDVAALFAAGTPSRTDFASARPAYPVEPPRPLSTSSPPPAVSSATLVSKTVLFHGQAVPYLVADSALPWRYHVDRRLAERYGTQAVIDAVAQWDGIPGSRWSTEFVSVVDHPEPRPRGDGTSVVYLREGCPERFLGGAFWNHDPRRARLDARHGTAALYGSQIDVGICSSVPTVERMRAVMAHEMGHVMGMAHLCEPGEICWGEEDGAGQGQPVARCRTMYYLLGACGEGVTDADHAAARHLYPTLPRLYGSSPGATAARASYATWWTHSARDVVVVAEEADAPLLLSAAALATAVDGPLLLAGPAAQGCLLGPGRQELARVADNGARVHLVGAWPETCEDVLGSWRLEVRRVADGSADAGVVSAAAADVTAAALEDRGTTASEAVLVPLDESGPPAEAFAAAAIPGLPLLVLPGDRLGAPAADWLVRHLGLERGLLLGNRASIGGAARAHLRAFGVRPVQLSGNHIARALRLAGHPRPAADQRRPVVLVPAGQAAESAVGATVAARLGAILLPTPDEADARVRAWLERRRPAGGYVIGDDEGIPHDVQHSYAMHVLPAGDPVPSAQTQRSWWQALPVLDAGRRG